MNAQPKGMTWAGWILTGLVVGMLAFSASMKLMKHPDVVKAMVGDFGYPEDVILAIGVVELACAVIYLIPQTAVLGAVLLTGYLGGAIATHVRIDDNFLGPAIGGILVWLAVFLRDPRIRAILPLRQRFTSSEESGQSGQ